MAESPAGSCGSSPIVSRTRSPHWAISDGACEDDRVPSPFADFIAGLPKAELHVHHVGSASPRIVAELAARHPSVGVPADPALLADYFTFRDFGHFIEVYLSVVDLINDAPDVRTLTYEVAR